MKKVKAEYGAGTINAGYRIHNIDGKDVREHRLVMEKHLGRKLKKSEVVHHKDENTLNNDISNLEVMSWSEHIRLHKVGKFRNGNTAEKRRCQKCHVFKPIGEFGSHKGAALDKSYKCRPCGRQDVNARAARKRQKHSPG